MSSPSSNSDLAAGDFLVRPLADFLEQEAGAEAIVLRGSGASIFIATLGDIDEKALEERLRAVIRSIDKNQQLEQNEAGKTVSLINIRRLPDGTYIEKPTCPTASKFWKWREFSWPEPEAEESEETGDEWKFLAMLAGICGVALLAAVLIGNFTNAPAWLTLSLFVVAMVAGGWDAAVDAFPKIRKGDLDIHFLMIVVAAGAASIGAWSEGALLLFLFSASGAIEHFALHRTYREIHSLTAAAPKTARLLLEDGETREVAIETLEVGAELRVRPDEVFPTDAEIIHGSTAADESALTGEATPVAKEIGETVYSGTLNLWGVVNVTVLRPARQSALQKIIDLIRNAEHLRAPSQRFTDRFGKHYTYGVLGMALVMFFVWWLLLGLSPFTNSAQSTSAFYCSMTLLVVASPCALVLSIPSAILAAIAWGAKRGILFRGGGAIEALAEIDAIALDKTGTLTTGDLQVSQVESFPPGREQELLEIAFTLESHSNHPIARAITAYGKRMGLQLREFDNFQSLTGSGLRAEVDNQTTYLGRRGLLDVPEFKGILADIPEPPLALTEVWIVRENLIGRILLADEVRRESRAVLNALHGYGLRTLMLTGDHRGAAEKVAGELGLGEVRAGLKPEDKVQIIRELTESGLRVAMVGDGVNDAPSLAAAHVSVAMGGRGSDAALEQADIVLMQDKIERLLIAYRSSLAARSVIRQNLGIALGTVVVMVGASLFGVVPLSLGVIAHEGSTLLVCLNSLRLLFRKDEMLEVEE